MYMNSIIINKIELIIAHMRAILLNTNKLINKYTLTIIIITNQIRHTTDNINVTNKLIIINKYNNYE